MPAWSETVSVMVCMPLGRPYGLNCTLQLAVGGETVANVDPSNASVMPETGDTVSTAVPLTVMARRTRVPSWYGEFMLPVGLPSDG